MSQSKTEVDRLLLKHLKQEPFFSHCMGDDGLKRIGLRVPLVRKIFKENYQKQFSNREDWIKFWSQIWKESTYMESMSMALYAFQYRDLNLKEVRAVSSWIDQVICWEHSDDLSKILAQVVEQNPRWILPTLERWNKAKNPWKRRQSVVGLIEYHNKRDQILPFKQYMSFVIPLLDDKDYYVQKGVGWTLREIYCLYPKETMAFFKQNLNRINSKAYSAAVEKLSAEQKMKFRENRKNHRRKLRQN